MSPKQKNKKVAVGLNKIQKIIPKNLNLNKFKVNPGDLIEKSKNKLSDLYTDIKKKRAIAKRKLEKKRKLDEKKDLLRQKKQEQKEKLDKLREEFFNRDLSELMQEVREIVGDRETYVSYDIDFVDPTFAPGTGTPEVGGPNSFQALQVVRELKGLNIVGSDMVEVSPPFDPTGNTAFLRASIMFELLCQMVNK